MKKRICLILAALMITNSGFAAFAEETAQDVQSTADESVQTTANEAEQVSADETAAAENSNVINLYVDPNHTDAENTYRNITQAITAANAIDKTKQQVIVNIKGGTYNMADTLTFTATDSGSSEYPVIYRAAKGETVIFNAGKRVSGTRLADTDAVKKKIPQNTRNKVFKIDLSSFKEGDLGNNIAGGTTHNDLEASTWGDILFLIYDGSAMPRATYPNLGWIYTANTNGTEFDLEDKKTPVDSWNLTTGDGWMQTIASHGYDYKSDRLVGYNAQTGMIKTNSRGGFANGRVRFVNLPELIDQPGEYSIDFTNKCIYFYPPDEKFNKEAYVTSFREPLIKFDKASNIVFEGITLENGGGEGIIISGTDNVTLKNCTIKNFTDNGIEISGTTNTKISGCTINNIGMNGIYVENGGSYKTLIPSGNVIEKCDIYTVGKLAPVNLLGVRIYNETGIKILNNRIHDTPHDALRLLESTACTIEGNEIYNAVNDTYDAGAVYSNGGVFKGVGSIFKNNYFHDIYLSQYAKGGSTIALYWDDEQSGMTSVGNIFDDVAFGMLVGGGDWNTVNNNIFYKSRASMTVDSRGESWSTSGRAGALEGYVSRFTSELGNGNTLWDTTYPYTTKFYNYAKEGNTAKVQAPDEFTAKNNVLIDTPQFTLARSVTENALALENNEKKTADDFGFADPDNYNFTYEQGRGPSGFEYIDFAKIGIDEKELSKPKILGPCDGATGIEGDNAVLSWTDANGADQFRVRIAVDKDFRKLVYDKVVKGTSVCVDELKYNRTYYWSVQPVVASKSEKGGNVSDTYSFTTAKTQAKDTTDLSDLLSSLGNGWKRVKEGNQTGMYKEGAVAELDKAVAEAETVLYNNASKMFTVKNVTEKLKTAIKEFNDKMNYEVVDIGDWLKDKDNWITKSNSLKKGDLLHVSLSDPETPEANATYIGSQLTSSQLLKFKIKVDFTGYQMWGFNTDNTTEHAWGSLGYSIVVFRDRFEVQKRYKENGNIVAQILKTYANEESIMTSDVWHTIETGVLSTVMGPRILVKVDGKTIVDYTDEAKPAANEAGWFKFTEQSGGIGITVAPADYVEE